MAKRLLDVVVAVVGLVLLTPVMAGIIASLWLAGTRRVLHAEDRVGRSGRTFRIHKFRTLRGGRRASQSVAAADDPDITAPGRFLRRWRLDELPQLVDVLRGAMSLVGPRPQQAVNLEAIDAAARERLASVRPGMTGPAVIEFLSEDEALAEVEDPVAVYRHVILPAKVQIELDYLDGWTLAADLRILAATAARLFSRRARRRSLAGVRALIEGATR